MYVRMNPDFVNKKKVIHIRYGSVLGAEHYLVKLKCKCFKAFSVTHVHFLELPNTECPGLSGLVDKLVSNFNPPLLGHCV